MRKNPDTQKTDGGELAVTGDTADVRTRKLATGRKPAGGIVTAVCVLVLAAAGIYAYTVYQRHSSKLNPAKLTALVKANDCSDKALQSVSAERPSKKQVNDSILLLSYRASCFGQLGRYQQAIDAYRQLKTYYLAKHDTRDQALAAMVDQEITSSQYNLDHPAATPKSGSQSNSDTTLTKSPYVPGATP